MVVGALFAKVAFDFVERRLYAVEQLLHQMIVEIGDSFQQFAACLLGRRLHVFGNGILGFAVSIETPRLHVGEVDVSLKLLGVSDWQLLGDHVAAVGALQCRQRACEVGARTIHLVDDEEMRHASRFEEVDDRLSLSDASGIGFHHHDGGVDAAERRLGLSEEVDESRAVDDGYVDVVRGGVGEPDGGRLHVCDVFGLVIGNGRSLGDRTAAPDRSRVRQNRLNQSCLACVMGTYEGNIA